MQLPEVMLPGSQGGARERRVVFVYYRVRPGHVPALLLAFERGMSRAGGWEARLMRRVDAALGDDAALQTWMEIYSLCDEAPASNDFLQESIERCARTAGMVDLIDGARHYEIFEPCA
jgi:hypothetical protein